MTEQQKPVRFHIMVPVYRVEKYLNAVTWVLCRLRGRA